MLEIFIAIISASIFISSQFYIFYSFRKSLPKIITSWYIWCQRVSTLQFTQKQLILKLNEKLITNGHYIFLQRMSIMAPLLGVIITAFGFFCINSDDLIKKSSQINSQSLNRTVQIIDAIRPLFLGVLLGAVLAMINQILLHQASRQIHQCCSNEEEKLPLGLPNAENALTEFTEKIRFLIPAIDMFFKNIEEKSSQNASLLTEQTEKIAENLASIVQNFTESTNAFQFSTSQFNLHLNEAVEVLREDIQKIPQPIAALTQTLATARQKIQELVDYFNISLREINDNFTAHLKVTATQITKSFDLFTSNNEQMKVWLEDIETTYKGINNAGSQMETACRQFFATVQSFDDYMTKNIEPSFLKSSTSVQQSTDRYEKTSEILSNTMLSIHEFSQKVSQDIAKTRNTADIFSEKIHSLEGIFEEFGEIIKFSQSMLLNIPNILENMSKKIEQQMVASQNNHQQIIEASLQQSQSLNKTFENQLIKILEKHQMAFNNLFTKAESVAKLFDKIISASQTPNAWSRYKQSFKKIFQK